MSPSSRLVLRRGVAGIEFALVIPVLSVLALATFDLVTYIRTYFRLEQVAAQMAEVVAQCQTIDYPGDVNRFQTEAQIMAGSSNITTLTGVGSFIITGVIPSSSPPKSGTASPSIIAWQYSIGNPLYGSALCGGVLTCVAGTQATLPGGYNVLSNQVLIVTEVTASVIPFTFSKLIGSSNGILHLNALFPVRSAVANNLGKVVVNAASSTTQGCGS